jgi:hypothetical protein
VWQRERACYADSAYGGGGRRGGMLNEHGRWYLGGKHFIMFLFAHFSLENDGK